MIHFGARHLALRDGLWMQPEPLLHLGLTNGDLRNPLGFSGLYAAGNTNLYQDTSGLSPGDFQKPAVPGPEHGGFLRGGGGGPPVGPGQLAAVADAGRNALVRAGETAALALAAAASSVLAPTLEPAASKGGQLDLPLDRSTANDPAGPSEAYDRAKHYGNSPTAADRAALGAGPGEVVDHQPPLVQRYYEGDPSIGEKPGWQMTPAERKASAGDRSRMQLQPKADSDKQGGEMSTYSKEQKQKHGL